MKRLIRLKQNIFAFAHPRKIVEDRIEHLMPAIHEHLLKVLIYDDSTRDLNHWIDELSEFVSIINDYEVKPNNKKLSINTYEKLFRKELGESLKDARADLGYFKATQTGPNKYPLFKITPELIQRTHEKREQFISIAVDIVSASNEMTADDIAAQLHIIFTST